MICLDEEIKRILKLRNFKKILQITKIVEFKITKKRRKLKFLKLWNYSLVRITKKFHRSKKLSQPRLGQRSSCVKD